MTKEIVEILSYALVGIVLYVCALIVTRALMQWFLGTAELIRQAKKQNEQLAELIDIFKRLRVNGKKE